MKKIICTVMAMAIMITSACAFGPKAKTTMSEIAQGMKAGQLITTVENTTSSTWGFPMKHITIKFFGMDKLYEGYIYDFN